MNELQQLKRVLCEVFELRTELERLWKCASPPQRDTLPGKARDYLQQREMTNAKEDPAVLEIARETIEALTKLNVELRKSLNVRTGPEV